MVKCAHCSARMSRTDWFCPNCKRSSPRGHARKGSLWLFAGAGALAGVLATAGWVAAQHGSRRPIPLAAEPAAEVSLREVPVSAPAPDQELIPEPEQAPAAAKAVEKRSAKAEVRRAPRESAPNAGGIGAISVTTVPAVPTFVYLNGGSLLGKTPLRDAELPAGRHKLVFWSPSVGGRSTRTVDVAAGETATIVERVHAQERFTQATGG